VSASDPAYRDAPWVQFGATDREPLSLQQPIPRHDGNLTMDMKKFRQVD
jgi:hypothetical protein